MTGRICRYLPLLVFLLGDAHGWDNESGAIFAAQLRKNWSASRFSDLTFQSRFRSGLDDFDGVVLGASYGGNYLGWQFSGGYQVHIDRQGLKGREHRFWEQARYRIPLENSYCELNARLEERYFDHYDDFVMRGRAGVTWYKQISAATRIGLGEEIVFNIDPADSSIHGGFSQNRVSAALRHTFSDNSSLEFAYQLRLLNRVGAENVAFHQVQLTFIRTLGVESP